MKEDSLNDYKHLISNRSHVVFNCACAFVYSENGSANTICEEIHSYNNEYKTY